VATGVINLPDGRQLSWHEFGDPDGAPVIYTSGTPVSGLGGANYDQAARAAGLRWISPDKPGYGGSGYHRKRSLTSWADDLAELADQLGLDRFALAGESGGGPFTLAAARWPPSRRPSMPPCGSNGRASLTRSGPVRVARPRSSP
jgi:pimeloyl-ACP methyl ester carboxylesterase